VKYDEHDAEMIAKLLAWQAGHCPGEMPWETYPEMKEWCQTHPELFTFTLNEERIDAEIKRLEAEGVEITPDIFPGIKLVRHWTIEGESGWKIESGDPDLNWGDSDGSQMVDEVTAQRFWS
jgi:hypothetical protein